jgi:hypothetical protein
VRGVGGENQADTCHSRFFRNLTNLTVVAEEAMSPRAIFCERFRPLPPTPF